MVNIIRLGDRTSHGGIVVAVGATHHTVQGIPVARLGDKCICPKKGHKNCTIVEGDPNFTVDGVPVAFDGHKTSCGATLIASLGNFDKG
ncbi:PAAR domain-containing protein [Aquabacterium sp. A7-Y]|uniref:PAAR domain-containing protein n=1 Tax=Aquabacterium sp. A7-Y TaxID=1349605 RepID=UPI00223D16F3|nr:PAAR domain-containing protein [Aquabacterium sp. A7-Y]MCW7540672.1 PAAR domain-containing protein [Aquabacterium sp. A7-Y]